MFHGSVHDDTTPAVSLTLRSKEFMASIVVLLDWRPSEPNSSFCVIIYIVINKSDSSQQHVLDRPQLLV